MKTLPIKKLSKINKKMGRASPKKYQKKKNYESFALYIYKVLKTIDKQVGITKRGMTVINTLVIDFFEQIALEASKLIRHTNKKTLSSSDIQTAIKLLLPPDLSEHAIAEGNSALEMFNQNMDS